jgi:hypothetical protein
MSLLWVQQDGVFLFLKLHPRVFFLNGIQTFWGWEGDPVRGDDGIDELYSSIIKWTGSRNIGIPISTVE